MKNKAIDPIHAAPKDTLPCIISYTSIFIKFDASIV